MLLPNFLALLTLSISLQKWTTQRGQGWLTELSELSCWGMQMLSVMIPGGAFVVPVRRSGRVYLAKRPAALPSADLARQLLYSAGFEDIQAAQLTSLQGFTQKLPGAGHPLGVISACRSAGPEGVAKTPGKLMQKILTPGLAQPHHTPG